MSIKGCFQCDDGKCAICHDLAKAKRQLEDSIDSITQMPGDHRQQVEILRKMLNQQRLFLTRGRQARDAGREYRKLSAQLNGILEAMK